MSLLPASSSRLMHVLAETIDARLAAIPIAGPDAVRPETAPDVIVPYLAWGWSVDLWDMDWPMSVKRQITADALEMHRLKGTEAGIRRYLAYTDAADVVMTTPPQDFYAAAGPESDPAWRAWLDGLPEIRLYQVRSSEVSAIGMTADTGNDDGLPETCFLGAENSDEATFFAAADLIPIEIEYAVMVDGGVQTDIGMLRTADTRTGMTGDVIEFYLPGLAGGGAFASDIFADDLAFLDGAPSSPSALKVALGPAVADGEGWALALEQASYVQDVQPEAGVYEVVSPAGLYANIDYLDDATAGIADTAWGTYEAIRLMRPGLTLPPAASYLDADRLGMAPYTAEIRMALPSTSTLALLHPGAAYAGDLFAGPDPDLTALDYALDAVSAAQSARDRLAIDLDIPNAASLMRVRRLSSLTL